jgi:cold shock CspA family protein
MSNIQIINGTVKWFSKDKGYGFITDENNIDYHFSIREIVGAVLPNAGSKVQFQPDKNNKGPFAREVSILKRAIEIGRHVLCKYCKIAMIPRMVFYYGRPSYSICPFCGSKFIIFKYSSIFTRLFEYLFR